MEQEYLEALISAKRIASQTYCSTVKDMSDFKQSRVYIDYVNYIDRCLETLGEEVRRCIIEKRYDDAQRVEGSRKTLEVMRELPDLLEEYAMLRLEEEVNE